MVEPEAASRQITTKNEGGGIVAGSIVALPASHVAKTCPMVKRPGGRIALRDFKEDGLHAQPGKAAQMQINKLPANAFPASGGGYRNRENLRFTCSDPGQNKPDRRPPYASPMSDYVSFGQQSCKLVLAPGTMERLCVQRRKGGGIHGTGFR
jgi:hypothetical protein